MSNKWRLVGSAPSMAALIKQLETEYFFGPIGFDLVKRAQRRSEWSVSNRKGTIGGYRVVETKGRWRFEIQSFN